MNANFKVAESLRFADNKVIIITNWHAINEVGIVPYFSMEAFEKNLPTVVSNVVAVFTNIRKK